jgi:uncharacterized membrane protein YdjX (TVP38/TMEM64 family)
MTDTPKKAGFSIGKLLPFVAIVAAVAAGHFFLGDSLSFEALGENREALNAWRDANYPVAIVTYIAIYALFVAFSLPGASFLTLGGGLIFGLLAGTLATVTGATVGAAAIFLAAKTGFGDTLRAKLDAQGGDGLMSRMRKGIEEDMVNYLLIMRLVPAIPFFIANLAPSFFGVPLRTYVWTTFLGIIPGTAIYTWIGVGLGEVFASGATPDLSVVTSRAVLGPLLGLAALAALPVVLKSVKGRKAASSPAE